MHSYLEVKYQMFHRAHDVSAAHMETVDISYMVDLKFNKNYIKIYIGQYQTKF